MQGEQGRYVYIVNAQDEVEMRAVTTGSWYEENWIIKSGLKKGDEVIRQGINKVNPGSKVQVINRPKKSRKKS
jgi:membrane fusion protein (multidrug efflux system)